MNKHLLLIAVALYASSLTAMQEMECTTNPLIPLVYYAQEGEATLGTPLFTLPSFRRLEFRCFSLSSGTIQTNLPILFDRHKTWFLDVTSPHAPDQLETVSFSAEPHGDTRVLLSHLALKIGNDTPELEDSHSHVIAPG